MRSWRPLFVCVNASSKFKGRKVTTSLSARFFSIAPTIDMHTVNTTERLARLRSLMKQHELDIYSLSSLSLTIFLRLANLVVLKLFPRKIAMLQNTSRHVMPAESLYLASLDPQALPSSHKKQPHWLPMVATSTRPASS